MLDEVIGLFPSTFIHVGGDECPKNRWKECPKCQARIKAEGLKNEEELQSYFIRRIEENVASKGRRLIGWDEILEGGLAPKATVMSWRGMDGATAAAQLGHDYVATPTSHCYLDNPPSVISLEKVYSFEPIPQKLSAAQAAHCLGVQGNLWAEHTPTPADVNRQIWPRLCALAEVGWSPKEGRNGPDFLARIESHPMPMDGRTTAGEISVASLLGDMTDLAAMAEFPDPPYTTRQFSSYDRASTTPADPKTWFANNDSGNYLRIEDREGRKEYVMADMRGPGAIVRLWSPNPGGTLRIYLDGKETPALAAPMADLLGGKHPLLPAPIATELSQGWNLYFPIPYAKSCKVTCDKGGQYYHVGYRTYPAGTPVKTFTLAQLGAVQEQVRELAKRLAEPQNAAPAAIEWPTAKCRCHDSTGQDGGRVNLSGPRP